MTIITFPRDMPSVSIITTSFEPDPDTDQAVTAGGEGQVVERGRALWKASYTTPVLYGSDFCTMSAWLTSLESPPQKFWAVDTRARYPFAYRGIGWTGLTRAVGGAAFDGTCTLETVGSDGVSLGLSGLPNGFVLGPEDRLSFPWDSDGGSPAKTREALHRIVSASAAASSGGLLTVEVRPITSAAYSTGVTVRLGSARFKADLVKGSVKKPRDDMHWGTFSFDAIQTVRRT